MFIAKKRPISFYLIYIDYYGCIVETSYVHRAPKGKTILFLKNLKFSCLMRGEICCRKHSEKALYAYRASKCKNIYFGKIDLLVGHFQSPTKMCKDLYLSGWHHWIIKIILSSLLVRIYISIFQFLLYFFNKFLFFLPSYILILLNKKVENISSNKLIPDDFRCQIL